MAALLPIALLLIWSVGGSVAEWSPQSSGGVCVASKYSSIDGSCNNVLHPDWGMAGSSFLRLLPPKYDERTPQNPPSESMMAFMKRISKKGHHEYVTSMLPVWAEMVQHDISTFVYDQGGIVNGATGFLDASPVYGNTQQENDNLRSPGQAELNLSACRKCGQPGSGVGALLSTLVSEHNRLAGELGRVNPHWSPDTRHHEARRLVIAQLQHITYSEFLPTLLGEAMTNEWSLKPAKRGRFNGYSSSIRAGTFFSSALAPMLVTSAMIPHTMISMDAAPSNKTAEEIEDTLIETIAMILESPAQLPDLQRVGNLFRGESSFHNSIELSHKRRLPRFPDWMNLCTGSNDFIDSFDELSTVQSDNRKLLAELYKNPNDVDLLVGGMVERVLPGSLMGPTFTCILANQFTKLRESDRYWYENDIPPTSFSKGQLQEIRKVTLSGLLCANVKGLRSIQPRVFLQKDPYLNTAIDCELQPTLDLSQWKEAEEDNPGPQLTMEIIKEAVQRAESDIQRRQQTEFLLWSNKGGVDPKSPVGTAAAFSKPNKQALLMANNSLLFEYASRELLNTIQNTNRRRRRQLSDTGNQLANFLSDLPGSDLLTELDVSGLIGSTPGGAAGDGCREEEGACNPRAVYRTYSGHCNNLERPNLGKSLTTFARLLPSVYENRVSSPRVTSVTGVPLPSPRLVSQMIHADISHLHGRYTLMVMQFAQFVDHDITFTPVHRGFFASIPDCRSCDSPITVHPECMPIHIPPGDPFYPQVNQTTGERFCLPFMRSLPGQQHLGPREQINQNSGYLDGSHIYGETACLARELRSYGGRLNVTVNTLQGKDLLPQSPSHPECRAPSGYCFIAGDGRASEQPALTAIHTIFMREHNRLVDGLRAVNVHWGDERLYQTARKINIATYQHILYNEFLPRLLGWNAVNLYGLKLNNQGYYQGYSNNCNPNVVTEFASAAFRIGHSLLRPHLPRMTPTYTPMEPVLLRDVFFNPDIIRQTQMVDELIRGLVSTPMENLDQFITGEITNHLFEEKRVPHSGMDLPALNIQRARDHGIPPYNEYRGLCNLKRATTWEDLSREIPNEVIARLRHIYPSVNDIDLFPGGLSERPLQGGLVGPTFACIIGLQFRQLRKCDRFWYESGDPLFRFTEAQLAEIRKSTLSKVLCDNMDIASDIQRSVLDQPSDFLNPRVPCNSIPHVDLNAWREPAEQGCQIAGRTVPVGDSALPTPCTSCVCTSEGAQCASLRVTDCDRLLREAGRDAILRDEVCAAQCSAVLLSSPGPTLEALEDVVSLTTSRPPTGLAPGATRGRQLFPPTNLRPPPPPSPFGGRNTHRTTRTWDFSI
ncbi:peroxidase-like protein isoform X2 [Nilaparvata lugens]|uniref:peroxidase-like protein isoform X2 n=1 Tax=Nilaparvata lugens TaxID=108931 RepID=UPI00193DEEBE|nr:peroxidase-like protein isoform X2 [Nilaparvata lugens]